MIRSACSILLLAMTPGLSGLLYAQGATTTPDSDPNEYSVRVSCAWEGSCDKGISISGGASASLEITGVPGNTAAVTVNTHEERGALLFPDVPIHGKTITLTFFKSRFFAPAYKTRSGGSALQALRIGREPAAPQNAPLQVVLDGITRVVDITVSSDAGSDTLPVWVQWRPWRVETGGFYAYSWAHDQRLVTETVAVDEDGADGPKAPVSQTKVVAVRRGDNVGPATGVTFFFHPGNYPNLGFEFGTAANGNNTSWFVGVGARLLQPSDRSLLTLAAGISRVSVTTYPGIEAGQAYVATNPLLTGRTHYTNRPYISLGLGISFGGNGGPSGATTKE